MTLPSIVEARRGAARLILLEQAGPDATSAAIAAAAEALFTVLCQRLALLVGSSGASALLARAMRDLPGAAYTAAVRANQPRYPELVAQLRARLSELPAEGACSAAATLFADFAAILGRFVGDSFAERIFHDLWPQFFPERNAQS